jgi:hypothetical protein
MCNAHNHSFGCGCGFGGDTGGGGGRGNLSDDPWQYAERTGKTYRTRCPVGGADVFFYQSPYDGRVFFDDLGWPWPKHPCTDHSTERGGGAGFEPTDPSPSRGGGDAEAGWDALHSSSPYSADDRVSVTGEFQGQSLDRSIHPSRTRRSRSRKALSAVRIGDGQP